MFTACGQPVTPDSSSASRLSEPVEFPQRYEVTHRQDSVVSPQDPQPPVLSAHPVDTVLAGKHYQIVGSLGRGATGEVYVVVHSVLKRRFALKVTHPQYANDARVIERMRIEAQATARLRHKNIVEIVDFWVTTDGRPCVVMELLQGATVAREVLGNGPLPAAEAVEYTLQLLSVLRAAHDLGAVHRDIKPENLFLHQQPERPRILKVLDLGFARVLPGISERAPLPATQPTATGTVVGTPRFASPEALRGERVDSRADLFAVGAVLYFMLTRRGAYDRMMTIDDANAFDLVPPSAIGGPDVTPDLDTIVLKANHWRPEARYQTATEFARDLLSLRSSTPPAVTQRTQRGNHLIPTRR
jgi:eukaryotic-like serine/threonine-protein kinase